MTRAELIAEFVLYFTHPSSGYGSGAPAWPDCTGHTPEEVGQVVGEVLTCLDLSARRIEWLRTEALFAASSFSVDDAVNIAHHVQAGTIEKLWETAVLKSKEVK